MKHVLCFLCCWLSSQVLFAELPHELRELQKWQGAILQRGLETPLRVKVRVPDATPVTLRVADREVKGRVQQGHLESTLPAFEEYGGPYTLQVEAGRWSAELTDVYVGEVWLCVGQSNMMFPMGKMHSSQTWEPALGESFPLFRFSGSKGWIASDGSKGSLTKLAGTPYYFGRELHKALQVPIGLKVVGAGGTSLWQWTPESLHEEPELADLKAIMLERNEIALDAKAKKLKLPKTNAYPAAQGFSSYKYPYFPVKFGSMDYSGWIPNYPSRGIVFWQGENDVGLSANYEQLFGAMISLWREKADREWPFIFIQLPSYRGGADGDGKLKGIEGLRDAQRRVAANMDNTHMMVSLDIFGEKPDIHPSNKQGYGTRLAQTVLGMVYEKDVPWRSPEFTSVRYEDGTALLRFDHVGGGLRNLNGDESLREFQLAGKDQVFHPAEARITAPNEVTLSSDAVAQPVAVRYAWNQAPHTDLVGEGNLPVSPFRSDDWELFPLIEEPQP